MLRAQPKEAAVFYDVGMEAAEARRHGILLAALRL